MLYFAFRFKIATHTLATFVAAIRIVRAAMLAQTTGTNPIATTIANKPHPTDRSLFTQH